MPAGQGDRGALVAVKAGKEPRSFSQRTIVPTDKRLVRWFRTCEQHPEWESEPVERGPTPISDGWRESL